MAENNGEYYKEWEEGFNTVLDLIYKDHKLLSDIDLGTWMIESPKLAGKKAAIEAIKAHWKREHLSRDEKKGERKVIQIEFSPSGLIHALCEDGTIWLYDRPEWTQLSSVPEETGSVD